ncbi:hypothetical protein EVAR_9542_1 [Eumeta japonica]|uniref:Uncharacterized protein n=1 Tax=Eumeta variegata TaxID=151549 RepID=A0A4C1U3U1_EUMVA|nr:hypothetical protein EVAR_9542_1 [Eumeta japonica]
MADALARRGHQQCFFISVALIDEGFLGQSEAVQAIRSRSIHASVKRVIDALTPSNGRSLCKSQGHKTRPVTRISRRACVIRDIAGHACFHFRSELPFCMSSTRDGTASDVNVALGGRCTEISNVYVCQRIERKHFNSRHRVPAASQNVIRPRRLVKANAKNASAKMFHKISLTKGHREGMRGCASPNLITAIFSPSPRQESWSDVFGVTFRGGCTTFARSSYFGLKRPTLCFRHEPCAQRELLTATVVTGAVKTPCVDGLVCSRRHSESGLIGLKSEAGRSRDLQGRRCDAARPDAITIICQKRTTHLRRHVIDAMPLFDSPYNSMYRRPVKIDVSFSGKRSKLRGLHVEGLPMLNSCLRVVKGEEEAGQEHKYVDAELYSTVTAHVKKRDAPRPPTANSGDNSSEAGGVATHSKQWYGKTVQAGRPCRDRCELLESTLKRNHRENSKWKALSNGWWFAVQKDPWLKLHPVLDISLPSVFRIRTVLGPPGTEIVPRPSPGRQWIQRKPGPHYIFAVYGRH